MKVNEVVPRCLRSTLGYRLKDGSPAADQLEKEYNQGDDEKNVDVPRNDVEADKTYQP